MELEAHKVTPFHANGLRIYPTPGGYLPSVTTILKETADSRVIDAWRERVGEAEAAKVSEAATQRGTALHKAAEDFLLHGTEGQGPWWNSVQDILRMIERPPLLVESCVWHPLGFAGTIDCLGMYRDTPVTFDWKTANRPKNRSWIMEYMLQATAYAGAANFLYQSSGLRVQMGAIVIALEDQPGLFYGVDRAEMAMYWKIFRFRLEQFKAKRATEMESILRDVEAASAN